MYVHVGTENTESAERKARGLPAEKIGSDE